MGRAPCCQKVGLNRGAWTAEEDNRLVEHILKYGHSNWRQLPKQAGLLRCGKSCRLRWINYLRPDIKRGSFTKEEEDTLIKLHAMLGNKWSRIASYLPGRTDNEIKNVWNTHIKKKLGKSKNDNRPSANKLQQSASSSSVSSSISCIDQTIPESENHNTTNQISDNAEDEMNMVIAMDPAELWNILEDEGMTLQDQVLELDPDKVSHSLISPFHANFANIPIEPGLIEGLQIGPISTTLDSQSKPGWLAELEQELDSWETATTDDANHQEGDDPVCSYFKMPLTSPSIFDLFP